MNSKLVALARTRPALIGLVLAVAAVSAGGVATLLSSGSSKPSPTLTQALPSATATDTPTVPVSPSATPASPSPSVTPAGPPDVFSRLARIPSDDMITAGEFLYVQVNRHTHIVVGCQGVDCFPGPLRADYIAKFALDGTQVSRIEPWRWLPDFNLNSMMASDGDGVWITGELWDHDRQVPLDSTQATSACPSISRTGPAGDGEGVLMHIDLHSDCPTEIVNFTDTRGAKPRDPHNPGDEFLPSGLAFVGRWLWIACSPYVYGMDPKTGIVQREQGIDGDILGSAFGSLWINHPLQNPWEYPHEVWKVDGSTGHIEGTFTPGAESYGYPSADVPLFASSDDAAWWVNLEQDNTLKLVRYDLKSNSAKVISNLSVDDLRFPIGGLAYSSGKIFIGRDFNQAAPGQVPKSQSQILVFNATTGDRMRDVSTSRTDPVKRLGTLGNALFASLNTDNSHGGLWWINANAA